jgi:hypothetical protein
MNLRKVVAVAALAVVGIVGAVSAQTAIWDDIRSENKLKGDKAVAPVEMEVRHTITLTAEMEAFGPGLTGVLLEDIQVDSADFVDVAPANQGGLMQFGLLRVTTNYPMWDIGLSTRGGGTLSMDGDLIDDDCVTDTTWENFPAMNITTTCKDPYYGPGIPLTMNNGADTLKLLVAIGVVNLTGSTPTAEAHTPIPAAVLSASDSLEISFAEQLAILANAGTEVTGRDLDPADAAGVAALGFGMTPQTGTMFYVNVGVDEANYAALSGNPEGEYYETFTFSLYAKY